MSTDIVIIGGGVIGLSIARELHRQGYEELNQPAKAALLEILADPVTLGDDEANTGPLMVQLHRYVGSLVRCYIGEARALQIPRPVVGGVSDPDVSVPLPFDGEGLGEG